MNAIDLDECCDVTGGHMPICEPIFPGPIFPGPTFPCPFPEPFPPIAITAWVPVCAMDF